MVEIIFDIWYNIVDLYQQFMGVPEGVSYALFGSRKKKKAKKKLAEAQQQIDDAGLGGDIDTGALEGNEDRIFVSDPVDYKGSDNDYTDNTGGGNSHENMPPYHTLLYIMKL